MGPMHAGRMDLADRSRMRSIGIESLPSRRSQPPRTRSGAALPRDQAPNQRTHEPKDPPPGPESTGLLCHETSEVSLLLRENRTVPDSARTRAMLSSMSFPSRTSRRGSAPLAGFAFEVKQSDQAVAGTQGAKTAPLGDISLGRLSNEHEDARLLPTAYPVPRTHCFWMRCKAAAMQSDFQARSVSPNLSDMRAQKLAEKR